MIGRCKVDGCEFSLRSGRIYRGWCPTHYARWWRTGSPDWPQEDIRPLPISLQWATWLAGVIDCEGWIGMFKCRRANGVAYWIAVGVGNTNPKLPKRLLELTGVGRITNLAKMANPRAKPRSTWMVNRHVDVKRVLATIQPYLLLKQEQAALVLSLPPRHAKANALKAEVKARLAVLNKKGV